MNGEYYFRAVPKGDYYLSYDIAANSAYLNFDVTLLDNNFDSGDSDILPTARTNVFNFDPFYGNDFTIDAGFHLECAPPSVEVSGN